MAWASAALALLPATALIGSDSEFQLTVDGAPKSYRLDVSNGLGETQRSGRHDLHIGVLADLVVTLPYDGFTDQLFPVGGVGFGYGFRRDDDFLDQAVRLKFHYGLAYQPFKPLRFDFQVFLAPQGSFVTLPREMVESNSERDWFLGGIAYGAEASVDVRFARWIGMTVRGGIEGDYVSASGSSGGTTVTLRDGGAVVAAGIILSSD